MSELLKINVNEHTERKGQLTYLSWAWAWAEVLKIDPTATWEAHEKDGLPVMFLPDESAMVKVSVTIKADRKTCLLPVMDHKNKAVKKPDSFSVNTAIMRCLAKAIAMHGLGLYIYAGEDLPEGEEPEPKTDKPKIADDVRVSATEEAWKSLDEDNKRFIRALSQEVVGLMPDADAALNAIVFAQLEPEQKAGLWHLLDSTTRTALNKAAGGKA